MTGTKRASGTMVSDANDVDLLDGLTLDTTAAAASPLYGSAVAVDKPGDVAFVLTTATVAGTAPVLTVVVQQSDTDDFFSTDTALVVSTTTAGVAPVNEVQLITPAGSPDAGTWTITYAGQTTAGIAFDADAATIQAALEALSNVGVGDITVTGGPVSSGAVTLTFTGALAGTNVAQVTCSAAGLAVNEVQLLTRAGTIDGGTWTITYAGQTTGAIAFDADAATITTALDALSNLAPGDCIATGGPISTTNVTLTFGGTLAGTNVAQVTVDTASLTGGGTVTPSTTTAGKSPTLTPSTSTAGVAAVNEVQRITPTAAPPNGGTFTITWEGQTTSALAYNASAATIQAAMEALSNVGDGECVCAGGPINEAFVSFTFTGALGGANQDAMTISTSGLTSLPDVFTLNTFVSTGTGEDNEVYSGVAHVNKKYVRAKVTVADGGTVDADYTGTTLYVRQPHWHRTGDSTERTIV